jgi:hypothetical protein
MIAPPWPAAAFPGAVVVYQFEMCSHARNRAPSTQNQPNPTNIQLTTLILRCLSSIESPGCDAGGFSGTLKRHILNANENEPTAPMKQRATGNVITITV